MCAAWCWIQLQPQQTNPPQPPEAGGLAWGLGCRKFLLVPHPTFLQHCFSSSSSSLLTWCYKLKNPWSCWDPGVGASLEWLQQSCAGLSDLSHAQTQGKKPSWGHFTASSEKPHTSYKRTTVETPDFTTGLCYYWSLGPVKEGPGVVKTQAPKNAVIFFLIFLGGSFPFLQGDFSFLFDLLLNDHGRYLPLSFLSSCLLPHDAPLCCQCIFTRI